MSDGKISIFTKADLDMRTYLRKVLIPYMAISATIFLAVGVITTFLYMPTALKVLMFLIPVVLLVYAAAYPYIVADSKRISINSKMPYFITYFAVLSTSEMSRADLIAVLSHDPKLGAIADELKKVHTIVNRLHLSMPEAFRFSRGELRARCSLTFLTG